MAGKTLPYRRTHCGTKRRWPCGQIKGSEGDPSRTTLDDSDSNKGSPWASSEVLRDVLPDDPRPKISWDEPPFLPAEERPEPGNTKNSKDILR